MAAEEGHCHGGSSRIRSRGRDAEADAANLGSETSTVLDSTGAGMGDVAGPPAGAEVGDGTEPLADGSVPLGGHNARRNSRRRECSVSTGFLMWTPEKDQLSKLSTGGLPLVVGL